MPTNSFADYKNRRKNVNSVLDKLKESNEEKKKDYSDSRFYEWKPDDAGNAYATIRFLPSIDDGAEVISRFRHSFKNNSKWYIETCPTSIGKKCPLCEINSDIWAKGTEADKDIVRSRSRRKDYFANILIVSDKKNPQNEGKVFLFKFGQAIYTKIMEKLRPEFEDDKPLDVFDMFNGANFQLRVTRKGGYANYDSSTFLETSSISKDDSSAEAIFKQIHSLKEFLEDASFKPYDELKKRLEYVFGNASPSRTVEDQNDEDMPAPSPRKQTTLVSKHEEPDNSEEVTDADGFFKDM